MVQWYTATDFVLRSLKYIYPSFNQMLGTDLSWNTQAISEWPECGDNLFNELAKLEPFWILHSRRFYVTADHSALGRGLPTEALLKEDLAVDACDLYGLGNVQCQGGEKLQLPSRRITKRPRLTAVLSGGGWGVEFQCAGSILRHWRNNTSSSEVLDSREAA